MTLLDTIKAHVAAPVEIPTELLHEYLGYLLATVDELQAERAPEPSSDAEEES